MVDTDHIDLLKDVFTATYSKLTGSRREDEKRQKTQLTEIDKKIELLEERFALGEIERDIYARIVSKYRDEKTAIRQELEKWTINLSNLPKYVDSLSRWLASFRKPGRWEIIV